MKNDVFAFIADIKASRNVDDNTRYLMQVKLKRIIEKLNDIFMSEMISSFRFSAGDSVQCLFRDPSAAIRCFLLLSTLFFPYEIRAGLGVGRINHRIFNDEKKNDAFDTNYLDGFAYYQALEALDLAKRLDTRLLVYSTDRGQDRVINNMLIEASRCRKRLSKLQANLLSLCEFLNPVLNEKESRTYSKYFTELASFLSLDRTFYQEYMRKDMLFGDLFDIYMRGRQFQGEGRHAEKMNPVFSAEIMPRNTDAYLAKIYGVSPQNIWLLKKRGDMDAIRTLELLAVKTIGGHFADD